MSFSYRVEHTGINSHVMLYSPKISFSMILAKMTLELNGVHINYLSITTYTCILILGLIL